MAFYLVERYVPSMTDRDLAAALSRIDQLPGGRVRHLWTVLILGEDTCLSVFEATDPTAVEAANTKAASISTGSSRSRPSTVDRDEPRAHGGVVDGHGFIGISIGRLAGLDPPARTAFTEASSVGRSDDILALHPVDIGWHEAGSSTRWRFE